MSFRLVNIQKFVSTHPKVIALKEQMIFQAIIKNIGELSGVEIRKCFCKPMANLPSQASNKTIIRKSSVLTVKSLNFDIGRFISGESKNAKITKTNPNLMLIKEIKKKPSINITPTAKVGDRSLMEIKKAPIKTSARMLIIITLRRC
jgi:DNA helicase IV